FASRRDGRHRRRQSLRVAGGGGPTLKTELPTATLPTQLDTPTINSSATYPRDTMTDFQSQYGAPQCDADFGQPAQTDPQARKPKGRRPRKPKGVEKPRSGARTIILLAAVVGAVFAALYFAGADDPTLGGTYVVQVKRNVAAYTEITPDHLQPVQVNETLLATRQGETGEVVNYDGLFVATSPEAAIEAVFARPQGADSELSETVTRIARREIAAG